MSHLLNSRLLNGFGSLFNGGNTAATIYVEDSVSFENVSLNDGTSVVLTQPPKKGPARDLLGGDIPRSDGRYRTGDFYRATAIILEGYLKAASKSAMATLIDTLLPTLATEDGYLDITEDNGVVKRYAATWANPDEFLSERERYHLTIVPFTLKFVCWEPFAAARDYTPFFTALTGNGNQSVLNGGTAKAKPSFVLIFSAASSVTGVTIANETTGESITVTQSIAANDVLTIDGENYRVWLNDELQDYSGTFPELQVGTNVLSATVSGASFAAGWTTKFKKRYLL